MKTTTNTILLAFVLILRASVQVWAEKASIAVVTSDKIQTRLRVIRDSPKTLVGRLNSQNKGAKSEDIGRATVDTSQWVALDYDFRRKEYFVIDRIKSHIALLLDEYGYTDKISVLFEGISPKVSVMAYDWLRRMLYWADPAYQTIFRLSIGQLCANSSCVPLAESQLDLKPRTRRHQRGVITSVISTDITEPCSIVVDPVKGFLYWADDGAIPSIEMSTLDGLNRQFIIRGLIRPAGLTLDYSGNNLYWIERLSGLSVINACHLSKHTCVPKRVSTVRQSQLYDMDFHQGFLISGDLAVNRLVIYDVNTGQLLRQNWAGTTYGICVATRDRQPWKEISTSESLESNTINMLNNITEHGILFVASEKSGILLVEKTFGMGEAPPPAIPLVPETGITVMAVDIRRHRLFYFSQEKKSIFRADIPDNIGGSKTLGKITKVVSSWVKTVSAMAVDWSTGNLYWLDGSYRRLMVSRDDGSFPKVIHHEDIMTPQDLVIHSGKRLMFWSDTDPGNPRIVRSDLDGRNRKIVVKKNTFYERPYALTIDFLRNVLYWSDGQFLCRATLEGNVLEECKRRGFISTASVRGMDIMHDYIIWTDFTGGIKSADVDIDFPLTQVSTPVHYSDLVVSDVVYWHATRQDVQTDPCGSAVSSAVRVRKRSHHRLRAQRASDQLPACSQLCLAAVHGKQCTCTVGYWSTSGGQCELGITISRYFVFCDVASGKLFRQFTLLPDYYAFPLTVDTHVIDVAVDEVHEKIYWLDSSRNMIHMADLTEGSNPSVLFAAGNSFTMSKLELEPVSGLVYLLTTSGDVVLMSLTTGYFVFIVQSSTWAVHDLAVDTDNSQLFMTATLKGPSALPSANTTVTRHSGVILRSDLDGANLTQFLTSRGRPVGITVYQGSIVWTDAALQGVFSTAVVSDSEPSTDGNVTVDEGERVVVTLAHLELTASPGDVIVADDVVYFADRSKQAIQRFPIHGPAEVQDAGFPFMNEIAGLNYIGKRGGSRPSVNTDQCPGILVPSAAGQSRCMCTFHGDMVQVGGVSQPCQSRDVYVRAQTKEYGLCMVEPLRHGVIQGAQPLSFVLSGQQVAVTCDPDHRLSNAMGQSETRKCSSGEWTSRAVCVSALNYTVQGTSERGYVILVDSTTFVVPRNVSRVEVICIGGGGGGYDPCDKKLRLSGAPAGLGGVSRFGRYLRAHGGQGGSFHAGGRGGQGRTLFGGDGVLSSLCLGGGAAGETSPPQVCQLGRTSCPFCGGGGATPTCSRCQIRVGGCGGLGSEPSLVPGGADNFGGGATGTFGGGSGGGGGYSRKHVRVSPLEKIEVTVGKGGHPSAKPAGDGVVVVAWGDRIENLVAEGKERTVCKPFSYKLDEEDATDFVQRCFG